MPEEYTNRELHLLLKGFIKTFDDFVKTNDEQHKEIIIHQKTTNGRVLKLEFWRSRLNVGWTITTVILLPVAFLVVKEVVQNIYK